MSDFTIKGLKSKFQGAVDRAEAERLRLEQRMAEQRERLVPREPSDVFLAEWEAHIAREQARAEAQIERQIAAGTRKQRRRLPTARDRSEKKPDTAKLMPFDWYDYIVVAFSGGKDSLACVLHLLDQGVPPERIELWHYCVDGEPGKDPRFFDWPITEDYCRAVAEALGIRLLFRWREGGFERELLKTDAQSAPVRLELPNGGIVKAGGKGSDVTTRRYFPRTGTILGGRWCSGFLKVDVARLSLNNDRRFAGRRTLIMSGERGEESGNRAKYPSVEQDSAHSGRKTVTMWHPVIDWPEPAVWEIISRHRVRPHPAYYVGFSRLSCMPCIFGNDDQWATIKTLDPRLIKKIAGYEHDFYVSPEKPGTIHPTHDVVARAARGISYLEEEMPMSDFEDAVANAQLAMSEHYPRELAIVNTWHLPRGAGRKSGGPT